MSLLLFLLYLLCYLVGFSALGVLFLLMVRDKTAWFRREFFFVLSLALLAVGQSFDVMTLGFSVDSASQYGMALFFSPLSIFFFCWSLQALLRQGEVPSWVKLYDAVFLSLWGVVNFGVAVLIFFPQWESTYRGIFATGFTAFLVLTCGRYLVTIWRSRPPHPERSLATPMALVSLAYIPVFLVVDMDIGVSLGWLADDHVGWIPGVAVFFLVPGLIVLRYRVPFLWRGTWASPPRTEAWMCDDEFCQRYQISEREREVANLLLAGKSYAEMAEILFISLATVKTHVSRVYKKTNVGNKMALLNLLQDRSTTPLAPNRIP